MFKTTEEANTPNLSRHTLNIAPQNDMIIVSTSELNDMLSEILHNKVAALETEFQVYTRRWQENVKSYVTAKLKELTNQVSYMQSRYFHSDFNNRYRNHMQLEQELDMFDEGFAALLHSDSVEKQYPEYTTELNELRRLFQERFNTK